jgi:two-component system CitB family sensor kinase
VTVTQDLRVAELLRVSLKACRTVPVVVAAQRPSRIPFTRQMLLLQVGVLLAVVGLGFALEAWQLDRSLEQRFQQRALDVAHTLSTQPGLAQAVVDRDQPAVQARALAVQRATGALFVVITDDAGIRLAHPSPDKIGKVVSTSPQEVLKGREVTNIERGTLGLSARGKVPLRTPDGTIVGEVSVGFDASDISAALVRLLSTSALFLGGALLLGVGGTYALTRLLKRRTFGLEPSDLAELVREREAVLFGVSDGVIALDAAGVVTMANTEALRLIGLPVRSGDRLLDLDLPPALRRVLGRRSSVRSVAVVGERVLVVTHRVVQHADRPLGSVITMFDRTEVENLSDELDAVRLMTQALRAQRHEFANRLHTVHGLLHCAGPEPTPASAANAAAEAAEYVDALLDAPDVLVADDSDAIAPATIRAYLAGKITEAAELGVQLSLAESSWVPRKLSAPVEVVTVLGNLVNNALEAAHEATVRPARVEVDLLTDGNDLVISVANTGPGIPADRAGQIFTDGVSSRGPGRGLGLAIVRRTAISLGGTVTITHNGGDGAMTVFVARLPQVLRPPVEVTA